VLEEALVQPGERGVWLVRDEGSVVHGARVLHRTISLP
jgi:hypothetical protein